MMKRLAAIAATGVLVTGSAAADNARASLDLGMLHWIRDTVCRPGGEIVFVPVSNDVRTGRRQQAWAVIRMDNPDPDTAHVVTGGEKAWLKANGCDQPRPGVRLARQDRSARIGL